MPPREMALYNRCPLLLRPLLLLAFDLYDVARFGRRW